MKNMNNVLRAATALVGLALSAPASASCDETGASQADRDLWTAHGCWKDYFMWHYQAYGTRGSDWQDRGFYDACNENKEYAKHWNAAYLISYGLQDSNDHSFHGGQGDYQELGRARSSREWHAGLIHQVSEETGIYGEWIGRSKGDVIRTSCAVYDRSNSHANPASRAGEFVHEGTHAWLAHHGYDSAHHPASGNCTLRGKNCDYFYFHPLHNYVFGEMWIEDGTAKRFHSPNQSQVEFLCDVADFPASWVPASVRIQAAADANARATSRFINGPGYACGNIRPW